METQLSATEVRVLGCLIEKEMTTPDVYPLSLNGLTNACNQKSNRDPVLALDETDVVKALDKLRFKGLALQTGEGRVPKYGHNLESKMFLEPEQLAILCELFVRGPQTLGELRTRCERMRPFDDLGAVEAVLTEMMELEAPLVTKLPRQPGRKEQRYAHLLAGEPEIEAANVEPSPEAARIKVSEEEERIRKLEDEVAALKAEFSEFKKQFE